MSPSLRTIANPPFSIQTCSWCSATASVLLLDSLESSVQSHDGRIPQISASSLLRHSRESSLVCMLEPSVCPGPFQQRGGKKKTRDFEAWRVSVSRSRPEIAIRKPHESGKQENRSAPSIKNLSGKIFQMTGRGGGKRERKFGNRNG